MDADANYYLQVALGDSPDHNARQCATSRLETFGRTVNGVRWAIQVIADPQRDVMERFWAASVIENAATSIWLALDRETQFVGLNTLWSYFLQSPLNNPPYFVKKISYVLTRIVCVEEMAYMEYWPRIHALLYEDVSLEVGLMLLTSLLENLQLLLQSTTAHLRGYMMYDQIECVKARLHQVQPAAVAALCQVLFRINPANVATLRWATKTLSTLRLAGMDAVSSTEGGLDDLSKYLFKFILLKDNSNEHQAAAAAALRGLADFLHSPTSQTQTTELLRSTLLCLCKLTEGLQQNGLSDAFTSALLFLLNKLVTIHQSQIEAVEDLFTSFMQLLSSIITLMYSRDNPVDIIIHTEVFHLLLSHFEDLEGLGWDDDIHDLHRTRNKEKSKTYKNVLLPLTQRILEDCLNVSGGQEQGKLLSKLDHSPGTGDVLRDWVASITDTNEDTNMLEFHLDGVDKGDEIREEDSQVDVFMRHVLQGFVGRVICTYPSLMLPTLESMFYQAVLRRRICGNSHNLNVMLHVLMRCGTHIPVPDQIDPGRTCMGYALSEAIEWAEHPGDLALGRVLFQAVGALSSTWLSKIILTKLKTQSESSFKVGVGRFIDLLFQSTSRVLLLNNLATTPAAEALLSLSSIALNPQSQVPADVLISAISNSHFKTFISICQGMSYTLLPFKARRALSLFVSDLTLRCWSRQPPEIVNAHTQTSLLSNTLCIKIERECDSIQRREDLLICRDIIQSYQGSRLNKVLCDTFIGPLMPMIIAGLRHAETQAASFQVIMSVAEIGLRQFVLGELHYILAAAMRSGTMSMEVDALGAVQELFEALGCVGSSKQLVQCTVDFCDDIMRQADATPHVKLKVLVTLLTVAHHNWRILHGCQTAGTAAPPGHSISLAQVAAQAARGRDLPANLLQPSILVQSTLQLAIDYFQFAAFSNAVVSSEDVKAVLRALDDLRFSVRIYTLPAYGPCIRSPFIEAWMALLIGGLHDSAKAELIDAVYCAASAHWTEFYLQTLPTFCTNRLCGRIPHDLMESFVHEDLSSTQFEVKLKKLVNDARFYMKG